MDIFGVGGAELVAIFLIMLVVAGPKRMIQWAYIAGTYAAKLRAMWAEAMTYVQKEFEQAGLDVELPKEPPTRGSLTRELSKQAEKIAAPVSKPLQDTLEEVSTDLKKAQTPRGSTDGSGSKVTPTAKTPAPNGSGDLGTWSGDGSADSPG
jgi:Sec-independent protein translocase protein TatA